jgi:hypothetical protein
VGACFCQSGDNLPSIFTGAASDQRYFTFERKLL